MAEPDFERIEFIRHKSNIYLPVRLAKGIDPIRWASISQRIGRLVPSSFDSLLKLLDADFFPNLP